MQLGRRALRGCDTWPVDRQRTITEVVRERIQSEHLDALALTELTGVTADEAEELLGPEVTFPIALAKCLIAFGLDDGGIYQALGVPYANTTSGASSDAFSETKPYRL